MKSEPLTPRANGIPDGTSVDLVTAAVAKEAGITVYLMEEISDARLRCEQLKNFIAQALRLVSGSTHRDHFYEVAGDLLQGIPDSLFKMDKALAATALAASRLDYEELKAQLKPEKVEELETVLRNVRIRQIDRRAPYLQPAVPKTATELSIRDLNKLRDYLETILVEAKKLDGKLPPALKGEADEISEKAEQALKSLKLASTTPTQGINAMNRWSIFAKTEEEKQGRFEEGKPADPTKNMSPEDAKEWKVQNEKNKDKFKAAASDNLEPSLNTIEESLKSARSGWEKYKSNPQKYKPQLGNVTQDLNAIASRTRVALRVVDGLDSKTASEEEKESRFEEGKPADPTKQMSPEDAKEWKSNTEEYGDKFKASSYLSF